MADRAVRRFRSDELETWMSDEQVLTLLASTTGVSFADEDAEVVAVTSAPYRRALRDAGLAAELDRLEALER